MKLKLAEKTSTRTESGFPKLSVNRKGVFYLNSKAAEFLGIVDSKKLFVYQDEEDHQKWYLNLSESGYVTVKPKSKKDGSALFNITSVAQDIIKSFHHIGDGSLRFKVLEPVTYQEDKFYPLELMSQSLKMEIPDPNGPAKR